MRCSFPEDFDHSFTIGGPSSYESIDLSDHRWLKHTMRVGNVGTRNSIMAFSPHVRESKTLLDSGFHAVDSGFQLLDSRSFSVKLWFPIRIVSGISDSYTCIPDSKTQDSGFHKQKFPRFWIPNAKISQIPESGFLYMGQAFVEYEPCLAEVCDYFCKKVMIVN